MRADVYQKVTDRIVSELERGVRPWLKPWSSGNGEGRILRPLRANGHPLSGHQYADACVIRRKAASDSDAIRPPIPTEVGHPFRLKPATLVGVA